ncbi:MAG TPA: DUF2268 domain-containing protein [Candidatus Corynebacterium avicola]|uniref:DUF2268 domain-containing protein n=1 Tax=Candidatus Corynebacterium avicola TaxID=2838527 RepID=A0A9D1RPW6_9CORY|nr:DUF2268 domain-containing protein [Candidatus Corynebacterium avicola]
MRKDTNTITVLDTAQAFRDLLDAPVADRPDLVRAMWGPMAGMFGYLPGGAEAVDFAEVDRLSVSFDWSGDSTVSASYENRIREAIDLMVDADAWGRIGRGLRRGVAAIRDADPSATIPDLTVLTGIGDPDNDHFMEEIQGLTAFGGISGYLQITVWPTPTVLGRLEAIAVHELHHNIRYSEGGVVWDPMTVTLGEQVIAEGLADVFAAELHGEAGYTHFIDPVATGDGGDLERTEEIFTKVTGALDTTGMQNFTAWIHGDASARLYGVAPVGVPTGAGYAVGARLVRTYLGKTGTTAAQNVRTPADHIIAVAMGADGG